MKDIKEIFDEQIKIVEKEEGKQDNWETFYEEFCFECVDSEKQITHLVKCLAMNWHEQTLRNRENNEFNKMASRKLQQLSSDVLGFNLKIGILKNAIIDRM